ncbi:aminotransferase class V-fold PLP-dependent enzyme [Modicisalibacter luteus]|uniref:Aminotransferase class V-fold PLP-dependent enzyme n=2 Tax=Modicisalibacter luteus TaxID=453962 RepID=A0ABV7M418_9GAMM|nr:aminotransferase class V-fold PLP-dependent enzyme [Halomonas lutea]GHA88282.1 cysteine desulfurase-like protein [Halomonas lutea]
MMDAVNLVTEQGNSISEAAWRLGGAQRTGSSVSQAVAYPFSVILENFKMTKIHNAGAEVTANGGTTQGFSPDLLTAIRERFYHVDYCPFTGKRIFFENAGGSLTLKAVVERGAEVASIPDNEHRDNPASRAISRIVVEGRQALATLFGPNDEEGVIFGGETGTECLFRLIRSASMAAPTGGSVVACELEHPATFDATAQWARRTNRSWLKVPFNTASGCVTAEDYALVIRPDTRVATIIHTSPVTGMVQDVTGIAQAIRSISPECYIIVDGIQHAPHGALDVAAYGADGYVISLYKIFCRFNNGYAWVSPRLSTVAHDRLSGKSDDAWELGSRDPSALAGADEMVKYLEWLGGHFTDSSSRRERIVAAGQAMHEHEQAMVARLIEGTKSLAGLRSLPGVRLIGEGDSPSREGVVSFAVEGIDAKQVVAYMGERGIRVHARSDDVFSGNILRPLGLTSVTRISLAHYNAPSEIDECLLVLGTMLAES